MLCVCRAVGLHGLCIGATMCVFCWVLCVVVLGSFLCSWVVERIRVVFCVDRASSRLLLTRCLSPLLSLACIAFVFSTFTSVRHVDVIFSLGLVSNLRLPPPRGGQSVSATCRSSWVVGIGSVFIWCILLAVVFSGCFLVVWLWSHPPLWRLLEDL